jgi:DNA-binding HxlR family transcriptional regulator
MRWDEIAELNCSIARTLAVIGDRWTLLVLRDAFMGVRRFEHFQADLKVTRHVLADRLRKLEREGILKRVAYRERPVRQEYRLTEKGMELYPIMISMLKWGDRWTAEGKLPLELMHRKCGGAASPKLVCGSCGEELTARDVQPRARSEAGAEAIGGGVESPGESR